MDLSTYVRVGRYDLPEPTRTTAPTGNLLGQEASAVTYNWDTGTLFITGDGGTSITQITKTGQLIDTMTLAKGGSPQGTDFYDPEGLTYIGNGQFVMTEERDRQVVLFTYKAGTTLGRADTKTVDLGTFVPNTGAEGISYDPLTGGYIVLNEINPIEVYQTNVDFAAGTATNGSPTTVNHTTLFDSAKLGVLDVADVFALSNIPALAGKSDEDHLLILSQESAKIVEVDRAGNIIGSLTIVSDPGNPLSVVDQQHEGLTMDRDGFIYVVSENGGGDFDHPQLWVYAPSSAANTAPTAIDFTNPVTSIAENTGTAVRVRVAQVAVTDDGLGTNTLTVSGADAGFFEVDSTGLYIKAGTVLDYEARKSYAVTVNVDDATVGKTPDASKDFTLTVTDVVNENTVPSLYISEVAPWSSGNSPVQADWFEVTNNGSVAIDLTGWKMDDSSAGFATGVALSGITTIAPGESVIFLETADLATTRAAFVDTWFGGKAPTGLQIGAYSGGGVGLSTGGDSVVLFNSKGEEQANVSFAESPAAAPFTTFNNAAGLNKAPIITQSAVGTNGAFVAAKDAAEIGSPGTVGDLIISEVAPWSSGNSPIKADWFEVTNTTAFAVDITGWKFDDDSQSPAAAVALNGITTIKPGESVIFLESADPATTRAAFINTWFGGVAPAGLQIGSYTGSGIGLSTGGDQVNLYNAAGVLKASVAVGASPTAAPFTTFDNSAGLDNTAAITTASKLGVAGAFSAQEDPLEIGSPGRIANLVEPRFRLFAPDGFVGSVRGSGDVFGGNGFQDITVLAQSGNVTLDPSFNRGGDIIRLPGDAADYTIARFGSSAVLTHGVTTVTIPFGDTGAPLVFDDGARRLVFDLAGNALKLGAQTVGTTAAPVTAAADGTTLPTGANAAATARLLLSNGADASIAGKVNVFGSNGNEDIHVLGGNVVLDASFNRGGDELFVTGAAQTWKAYQSGSNLVLVKGTDTVAVPLGTAGTTIDFAGDDRTLVFDQANSAVLIGGQKITATSAATAETLTALVAPLGLEIDGGSGLTFG